MGSQPIPPAARRTCRGPVATALAGAAALALTVALGVAWPRPARAADEVPAAVAELSTEDPIRRGRARAALAALPDADDLITTWLRDSSRRSQLQPTVLRELAGLAGERGLELANSGLRALLRDEKLPADVRRTAAGALVRTATIADVGALGDGLLVAPDECCRALVRVGGDAALGALRRGGGDAPPPEVFAALARFGDRSRLPEVVKMLFDPATKDRACELLRWATGRDHPADMHPWMDTLALLDLADALASADADAAHAKMAAVADSIRPAGAGGHVVEGWLARIVADESLPILARTRAARTIGLSGVTTQNELLLRFTANQMPGELRLACANALARVGDLSCAMPLARMLVHDEDRDRLSGKRVPKRDYVPVDPEFVRALARIGLPGGLVPLFDLMEGEYRSGVQRDSMRAVQELSGGESFGFDTDSGAQHRKACVDRMRAWWRDARDGLGIVPRAADPGRDVFLAAVRSEIEVLGRFKFLEQMRAKAALAIVAEGAPEELVAALSSPELLVRTGVAEVMKVSGLRRFAAPLGARLAADTHPAAKTRFLWALETCGRPSKTIPDPGGKEMRDAVLAALGDRNIDVRIAAARTVGVVGGAPGAEALRAAREEPRNRSRDFRWASAGALVILGDRSAAGDVLEQLACDEVAQRAEGLRVLREAGIDAHGFTADGPAEARAASVEAIRKSVSPGGQR